jgi:ankyrin repeat protein
LAKLHLDSLLGKRSPKAVRIALDKLPTGTDAYDSAYDSAMERIEGQMAEQTELAKQALAFLTCARRPLSTLELQEAMGVEVGELELDPDNYPDIEDIIASCLGLVTVDDDRSIIRLVHYTTQEYLERTLDRWFPAAEAMIADVCLSYLCLNRYSDPAYLDPTKDGTWYDYAARNWLHHARRAPSSLERVVDFLTQETPLIRSYISWRVPIFTLEHIKELWITGLHFAAEYDLEDVIAPLLQRGSDLSRRDVYGQTPLLVAARKGRKAAAEQLLRHGSSIDERLDKGNGAQTGFTALHLASENGHVPIVRLLLEAGAAINSQGENDHTPLSIAVFRGRTEVVQVLLDAGADMTLHNTGKLESNSITLLGLASFRGHADIVQLLIAAGVDVNERYEDDFAIALWDSASRQRTDCIRILLEAGADPNLTGGTWENSPLIMVCLKHIKDCKDCVDIVKMLLDAGADIDHINLEGWTAYGFAKMKQNLCVAEYLLERGANPELGLNGQPDSPHSQ